MQYVVDLKESVELITLKHFAEKHSTKFGTSGLRGLNSVLTDKVCYVYTLAFLQYLLQKKILALGQTIQLAGDLRANTESILQVVQQAIIDSGYKANYCGKISTPALAYYSLMQNDPGIMVTGSHIPDNMNGIKFYQKTGEILKSDETEILNQAIHLSCELFDKEGKIQKKLLPLPEKNQRAQEFYCKRYQTFFAKNALTNMRVGVYAHSSVAIPALINILTSLGAEVIPFGDVKKFHSIDTEALTQNDIDIAKEQLIKYQLDTIVSADGDGDRPLITDELGNWLRGDVLGMLTAVILQANYVVLPISCNSSIDYVAQFKKIVRSKIGSPFVIEKMDVLLKEGGEKIIGYEANGGVLLGSDFSELKALPTRDSALPILCLLNFVNQQKIKISELVKQYCRVYTVSNSIKGMPTEKTKKLLNTLSQDFTAIQDFFNIKIPIKKIDASDGLRIYFDNEDIIHLRPSGNAPELRVYTEANTLEAVSLLNAHCIKQLHAIL